MENRNIITVNKLLCSGNYLYMIPVNISVNSKVFDPVLDEFGIKGSREGVGVFCTYYDDGKIDSWQNQVINTYKNSLWHGIRVEFSYLRKHFSV